MTLHVHLCSFQIPHREAMHNMLVYQLTQYYQLQWLPTMAWTVFQLIYVPYTSIYQNIAKLLTPPIYYKLMIIWMLVISHLKNCHPIKFCADSFSNDSIIAYVSPYFMWNDFENLSLNFSFLTSFDYISWNWFRFLIQF